VASTNQNVMLFDGAALQGPHPQTYFSKSKHVAVTVSAMPVMQHWRMWRAWSVMRTATARSSQRARSIVGEAMSTVISATLTHPPVPFRSAWRVSVVPAHSASEELDWRRKLPGVSTVVPGGGFSEGFGMCALLKSESVDCWGNDWHGQLGDGLFSSQFVGPGGSDTPVPVLAP
jgi:hypothetical protein